MVKLPLVFPPIETYQGYSFMLGIMLTDPAYSDIQYNGYIQLECQKTEYMSSVALIFSNALWDDYAALGYVEKSVYDVANFNEKTLMRFLCERLDQGEYLLLYDVDEYYLSNADTYKRWHVNHDTYVYGYDEQYFFAQAYQKVHLKQLTIKKTEIVKSLLSKRARKNEDRVRHFGAIKLHKGGGIKADREIMLDGIKAFFEADRCEGKNPDKVYGIGVYQVLMNAIRNLDEGQKVDLRPFRCVWEQKKLMRNRIVYMYPDANDDRCKVISQICDYTEMVFRHMMLYNMTLAKKEIEKGCQIIQKVMEEEKMWYERYIKEEGV